MIKIPLISGFTYYLMSGELKQGEGDLSIFKYKNKYISGFHQLASAVSVPSNCVRYHI